VLIIENRLREVNPKISAIPESFIQTGGDRRPERAFPRRFSPDFLPKAPHRLLFSRHAEGLFPFDIPIPHTLRSERQKTSVDPTTIRLFERSQAMKKFALFVFNGDPLCFIHALLNAIDMKTKGHEAKVILEGASVKLVPELVKPYHPLNGLWKKSLDAGLVEGVCKACSNKLGTLEAAKAQDLTLLADMSGHPGMATYRNQGYEIISF